MPYSSFDDESHLLTSPWHANEYVPCRWLDFVGETQRTGSSSLPEVKATDIRLSSFRARALPDREHAGGDDDTSPMR